MFELLNEYGVYFFKGIQYTLILSLLSLVGGTVFGLLISYFRLCRFKALNVFSKVYVAILRGTPLMVQILMVYYGTRSIGFNLTAFQSALIAVSLNSAAYVSEIIRSGIGSVDIGQFEAGRCLGLSQKQTMVKIIMPQAIKNILPALGNEFVTLVKETSIASTIGVTELMFSTNKVQSMSYQGFAPLAWATIFYFILTFSISNIILFFERRMRYQ